MTPRTQTTLVAWSMALSVTGFLAVVLSETSQAFGAAEKREPIRKLTVQIGPLEADKIRSESAVTVFGSQKDVAKRVGNVIARQIAQQVDFAKEDVVFVGWISAGPPFGELKYEIAPGKDGDEITFYVQEPKVNQRGMAARLGADFFAVPKKAKVAFGGTR